MNGMLIVSVFILGGFALYGMTAGFVQTVCNLAIKIIAWVIGIMITPHITKLLFKDLISGNGLLASHITVFVSVFIIINIVLLIVAKSLNMLAKLPILKSMNRILGLAAGFLEGVLILWVLLAVLGLFHATPFGRAANEMVNQSEFLTFLNNKNLIMHVLEDITGK